MYFIVNMQNANLNQITGKSVKRALQKQGRRQRFQTVNYFKRIKKEHGGAKFREPDRWNIYFDCETCEMYECVNNAEEEPMILPYLIGVCTDTPGSYRYFIGKDCVFEFFDYLTQMDEAKNGNLCAFNIDYDFHAIRPYITERYHEQFRIFYEMTDNKKFIFGNLKNRDEINRWNKNKKVDIRFVDLWRWNVQHSLKTYIEHILKLVYDNDGSVKPNDFVASGLNEKLVAWGFTRDSFKKLEIDPKKVNLHQKNGRWFYWSSKEDWAEGKEPKELDMEHELKYLKVDVTSLPLINKEQELMRKMACQALQIGEPIDPDKSITLPGFGKWLCEEKEEKYMTQTYRYPATKFEYRKMLYSYTGAFVAGNKNVTYLDEQAFKKLYPDKTFMDKDGVPRIRSYDVNSMYPWAMSLGLPYGGVYDAKPSGSCVTWYEVHFKSFIEGRTLYKWKPQYDFLNNSFFGDGFNGTVYPGVHETNKIFILKPLYELFISMCDVDCEVVAVRYQRSSKVISDFVDKLYAIKQNKDGSHPESTVKMIKLILNSLYGKMAEKFKETKIQWATDLDSFIPQHPELLEHLEELNIKVLDEETTKQHKYKLKVSPYTDLDRDCGFFFVENVDKRFDEDGDECRESITAGIFITSISRWKLLSTIKQEVDQGNVVLYCDTDSIKLIEFKKPKFWVPKERESDLGEWKNEGSFTHFGHPNKQKKYFMHNALEPEGSKKRWMVKTSGINLKYLENKDGSFDLETIKTLYNSENRVLIKNAKPFNCRNAKFQTVIKKADFKFVFENPKDKPTHILEDNVLRLADE